jgi:peptidoglycan-associated lipoprotein
MRHARLLVPSFAAVLLAACAGQGKGVKTITEITDTTPAPAAAAPEPERIAGACAADSECPAGQACTDGRCATAPSCGVVRVSFGFDSAQLDPAGMQSLRDDARCLAQRRAARLLVEGHCDERGTSAYNLALGAKRAETVKSYLADLGVTAAIETVSFGKELPAAEGTGEAIWAKNRRAELRLPGDARSDGSVFGPATANR